MDLPEKKEKKGNKLHGLVKQFSSAGKKNDLHTAKSSSVRVMKAVSAQSLSNKCKNYLLKIYSRHINYLNII